jgi:hypothetical protein
MSPAGKSADLSRSRKDILIRNRTVSDVSEKALQIDRLGWSARNRLSPTACLKRKARKAGQSQIEGLPGDL